ncbi:GLPGLI family protein [Pedobacter petrophilus]|uniref:GLPGLI family protein n=1 Tax=Pedobacter petrophilus TaxID=1908241 RepID=A0A7K0FVD7_9SPHI|nr:GLPGLI family protein [Pedobacter petrophilus]MRX75312.1 GLPGLI family protein [Pedobacter petrophilus]
MKLRYAILVFICTMNCAMAQNARFVNQGMIEFEKKVNVYALLKDQATRYPDNFWSAKALEEYQNNNPQFKTLKSELTFKNNQTFFNPLPDESGTNNWLNSFASAKQNNIILTNLKTETSINQKSIYEETYLVKDSIRKINWKITDEFRNIAGYDCRRANALIMDSIYVVAFYTDAIPVSGGPETFSGLPGMILGVALPREHITWFATKVSDLEVADAKLKIPSKGKPVNKKQLSDILKSALKDWGNYASDILKSADM